jgi:mono/diheme cytochrome c family protein
MKVLKILGVVLLLLVLLAAAGGSFIYWKSGRALARRHRVPEHALTIPTDSAALARGRHLGQAIAKCVDCHGESLQGSVVIDALPFARVVAPNLTAGRGGIGAARSDADLVRAIRHGVGPDGRALTIMPAEAYIHLTDADLAAIIAWVRSIPPVDHEQPATAFGPIGRMLIARNRLPLFPAAYVAHDSVAPYAAAPDTTVAYGRYLAWIGGCHACHNPALSGGPLPGGDPESPPPANITPGGLPTWTETDFFRLLREGRGTGGRAIDNRFMPWRTSGRMTDEEIRTLWRYLRSVPPREVGQT